MISSTRQCLFSLSRSWTSRGYGLVLARYRCPFMFPLYLRANVFLHGNNVLVISTDSRKLFVRTWRFHEGHMTQKSYKDGKQPAPVSFACGCRGHLAVCQSEMRTSSPPLASAIRAR